MSRVLIVGCGFPQLSLIRLARRLGHHVIGADLNPRAPAVKDCDEFVEVSTNDVDGLLAALWKTRADAITTSGSEVALKATAHVAARAKLPFHADPETIRRCQEKDAMRAGYEAGGVPVPPYSRCETFAELEAFVQAHGFPVVVKPSRGWGQRGVARVDDRSELAVAFDGAMAQSKSAGLAMVVVEAFLEGGEYSVNGWIEDGRLVSYCVTERLTVPGKRPLGVMVAELFPSGLPGEEEARVVEAARLGAAALGHTRGPCYSQVMSSPKGAVLLETAARMGGGFDADVTRLASGVDLYERVLGVALDDRALERSGKKHEAHPAAIAKFLIGKPGVVRSIDGVDRARARRGVVEADVFVPVGGEVLPLTDSAKRAGYVLSWGDGRDAVVATADAALADISLVTS
ncbi:MAG: ATP-grasp domain-containing protein [Deltaproteobacteria bacterium]|nr:ATP-grasp domain-containing protein [Deltaproteobacteria bacterium]